MFLLLLPLTTSLQTCFWNNEILTPIQKHGMVGPGGVAFKKLKILLDRMMLRRTKVSRSPVVLSGSIVDGCFSDRSNVPTTLVCLRVLSSSGVITSVPKRRSFISRYFPTRRDSSIHTWTLEQCSIVRTSSSY